MLIRYCTHLAPYPLNRPLTTHSIRFSLKPPLKFRLNLDSKTGLLNFLAHTPHILVYYLIPFSQVNTCVLVITKVILSCKIDPVNPIRNLLTFSHKVLVLLQIPTTTRNKSLTNIASPQVLLHRPTFHLGIKIL